MKKFHLLSTVTAGLLFTTSHVAAQGMQQQNQTPERAPAAQQNAPSEKIGPSIQKRGQTNEESKGKGREQSETTGQMREEGRSSREETTERMRDGASKNEMNKPSESKGSTNVEEQKRGTREERRRAQDEKRGMRDERRPGATMRERDRGTSGTSVEERERGTSGGTIEERERQGTIRERERGNTIGQGAAGSARLSAEQRTRITTIFRERREARPVRLNVPLRVGVRVPNDVRFYPLPTQVIEVYPEWRGFNYIQVGERILVIDPDTHEVVAILEI